MGGRTCVFWCVAVVTGPRACRTVPCSKCDQSGRATWGLAPARDTQHACVLMRMRTRKATRSHSRHTVASNDMQHIDLCEPDNMPVNNMALELLSPQHEAMINWRILRASANNGCMRVCVRPRMKKGYIHSNNENNQNKWCAACGCAESCLGMRVHCSTAEWHGLHGYSEVSVAHEHVHARALWRVLVWNRRYVPVLSRSEMRIKLSPSCSRQT